MADDALDLENELTYLGLYDKAREILAELGPRAALSYVKSSHRLLSKVYHPDLNPAKRSLALATQQRLNRVSELIGRLTDDQIIAGLRIRPLARKRSKPRILVVEDEFGLQGLFENAFLMEGYEVRVAVDGDQGYDAFVAFDPDLVFTDVIMPKMSGIELVRRIRQAKPGVKVVYVSGFLGIRDVKQELEREILMYNYRTLAKPFKLSTMLEMVNRYLDDRRNNAFVHGV